MAKKIAHNATWDCNAIGFSFIKVCPFKIYKRTTQTAAFA